jgi:archaellum biogenesis ATPase FlaH
LRSTAQFLVDFSEKYSSLPDVTQIKATTGVSLDPVPGLRESDVEWFLDEFETFTRRQELERAILKSVEHLEKGNFDPVEKLIKDAVQISLTKDMGTDYFKDPRARLLKIKNSNGQISTGWPCLDHKLYGGFNRGELQIFAGGSGSGKSLFMQNLTANWSRAQLNGVYISLELSEELCSWRIDSMMADIPTKDIFKNLDEVEMKLKILEKTNGKFWVKYMHAQSNVNDIRAYLKSLQIITGMEIHYLCVDYLDLLMPVSTKVSPSDLFIKDKYVSEELRNLAKELNILLVTASQLNRSAVEEVEFDHSHISGGISKINTADNVFGIFTSRHMREKGQYQLQIMKTRSSSGVGQKIDLSFDVDTLRIFDDNQDAATTSSEYSGNSLLKKLKPVSSIVPTPNNVSVDPDTGEIKCNLDHAEKPVSAAVSIQGSKLNAMLNQIKKGK